MDLAFQREFFHKLLCKGGIDLHCHSDKSDGSDSVSALLDLAWQNELRFLAISDHDTTAAYDWLDQAEARSKVQFSYSSNYSKEQLLALADAPRQNQLVLIPAVELSTRYLDQEVHILAYFLEGDIRSLTSLLGQEQSKRRARNQKILKRLIELGYPLPANFFKKTSDHVQGRVDLAQWLCRQGYVTSISEAFDRLLAEGRPAYIAREQLSSELAIRLVLEAGGLPCLAHPQLYGWTHNCAELKDHLSKLLPAGLPAIEGFHSAASPTDSQIICQVAADLNLIVTAGSDYHGVHKQNHPLFTGQQKFLV